MDTGMDAQSGNTGEITRREMARNLVALGLSLGALEAVGQTSGGSGSLSDECRKVLIERVTNTKYVVDEYGNIDLLTDDAVWTGDNGGAYHQDWLFHPTDGFKTNPAAALEKDVWIGAANEHAGASADSGATDKIAQILALSDELGLLNDDNLIYFALKAKIDTAIHGAINSAAKDFAEWLRSNSDLSEETLNSVAEKAEEYSGQPAVMTAHEGY